MMTKKTFESFAREIADYVRFSNDDVDRTKSFATFAARIVATVAKRENPRFDRDRFFRAAGLGR